VTADMRQKQPRHARILGLEEAARLGIESTGTCDWGGCYGETVAMRWSYEVGQYLDVCTSCKATARTPGRRP
jgi:hypothetical protein